MTYLRHHKRKQTTHDLNTFSVTQTSQWKWETHQKLKKKKKKTTSNNRAPQGDSRGLVLFTIYLKNALRKIRQPAQNANDILQLAYSYNVDFVSSISASFKDVNKIEKLLADVNLHIKTSKTEYMTVQKSENGSWQTVKKEGPLLGDTDREDICRRNLPCPHLYTAVRVRGDEMKTRLKLYHPLSESCAFVQLWHLGPQNIKRTKT